MTKILLGIGLGLAIGFGCRWLDLPVPAPPRLVGALLVVAMTLGYLGADRILSAAPATTEALCGGPDGKTVAGDASGRERRGD